MSNTGGGDGAGPGAALEQALPRVYDELRRVAQAQMARERSGHTLQATAVVHEAWQRLNLASELSFSDERHLIAIAAGVMRQVLVDHARKQRAEKRGGDRQRVTLNEADLGADASFDVLDLHEALEMLAAVDPDVAQLMELRYFAGMTIDESGAHLGISRRKIDQDWAFGHAWLARALKGEP